MYFKSAALLFCAVSSAYPFPEFSHGDVQMHGVEIVRRTPEPANVGSPRYEISEALKKSTHVGMTITPHINKKTYYPRSKDELKRAVTRMKYKSEASKPDEQTLNTLITYTDTFIERTRKAGGNTAAERVEAEARIEKVLRNNWGAIKSLANSKTANKNDWSWVYNQAMAQKAAIEKEKQAALIMKEAF